MTAGDSVATGSTTGTTDDISGSCGSSGGVDTSYSWTPPISGAYCLDTFGSDYDTVLLVMEGACGEREIACNDDARGLQSSVTLRGLEAGAVYTLVVSGFRGRSGNFRLNITGP